MSHPFFNKLPNEEWKALHKSVEARLCIGDGYIFCFDDGVTATLFAARLAQRIEESIAARPKHRIGAADYDSTMFALPVSFHFRAGVHVGPVYRFWDYERDGWNYIGDGINGGSRVLEAIGKDTDDVVYLSDEVRNDIIDLARRNPADKFTILKDSLHNRGRKEDKHGNMWRVYELNHMNVK